MLTGGTKARMWLVQMAMSAVLIALLVAPLLFTGGYYSLLDVWPFMIAAVGLYAALALVVSVAKQTGIANVLLECFSGISVLLCASLIQFGLGFSAGAFWFYVAAFTLALAIGGIAFFAFEKTRDVRRCLSSMQEGYRKSDSLRSLLAKVLQSGNVDRARRVILSIIALGVAGYFLALVLGQFKLEYALIFFQSFLVFAAIKSVGESLGLYSYLHALAGDWSVELTADTVIAVDYSPNGDAEALRVVHNPEDPWGR